MDGLLHQLFSGIAAGGIYASMALSVSGRAYVIESGLVVKTAPARELADDPAVREAYLGGA